VPDISPSDARGGGLPERSPGSPARQARVASDSELAALGELRKQFRELRLQHEELARVYGVEEAIFAELCRQKGVAEAA